MYAKMNYVIEFKHLIKEIELIVVPNNTLTVDLLLGRDFLNAFNIHLYMCKERKNIDTPHGDNTIINSLFSFNDVYDPECFPDNNIYRIPESKKRINYMSLIKNFNIKLLNYFPLDLCNNELMFSDTLNHRETVCSIIPDNADCSTKLNIGIDDSDNIINNLIVNQYGNKDPVESTANPDIVSIIDH